MILYHASPVQNLKVLVPKPTLSNNVNIGNYVFATENKLLALMYLMPKGFAIMMNPGQQQPNVVICGEERDVLSRDKGGSIYEVSSKDFIKTPQEELSDFELVSTHSQKPINETKYINSIDSLLSEGVDIYFTNQKSFDLLIKNPKQDELIKKLHKYKF